MNMKDKEDNKPTYVYEVMLDYLIFDITVLKIELEEEYKEGEIILLMPKNYKILTSNLKDIKLPEGIPIAGTIIRKSIKPKER